MGNLVYSIVYELFIFHRNLFEIMVYDRIISEDYQHQDKHARVTSPRVMQSSSEGEGTKEDPYLMYETA